MKKATRNLLSWTLLTLLTLAPAALAEDDIYLDDVPMRPGVDVDLHLKVFGDPADGDCQFAVHGLLMNTEAWRLYAETLGTCVVAIDLPGRNGSSYPTNMSYSDVLVDDWVTLVIASLEHLRDDYDIEPKTIVGHSQGGMIVQATQKWLVEAGSSLEKSFGIDEAILLGSLLPAEVPSWMMDTGVAGEFFGAFTIVDPNLGAVISIPTFLWHPMLFTNPMGDLVAGTPSVEEIEAMRAYAEPLMAEYQLAGLGPFARPSIPAGLFTEDTRLRVITFEYDTFFFPPENALLYEHLTGDSSGDCLAIVTGPDAIHPMPFTDPGPMIAALAALESCGYGDGE